MELTYRRPPWLTGSYHLRWLLLLEGLPAVALGLVLPVVLPTK